MEKRGTFGWSELFFFLLSREVIFISAGSSYRNVDLGKAGFPRVSAAGYMLFSTAL